MTATCHRHWPTHSAFQPEFQDSTLPQCYLLEPNFEASYEIFFTTLLTVLKRFPLSIIFYLLVRSPPEVRALTLHLNI